MKIHHKCGALLAVFLISLAVVFPVLAQDEPVIEDPVIFVIGNPPTYVGGSGWFAGYVIVAQSGTFTLNISATGGQSMYPITDVHVIALASDEAAGGGLKSLVIEGVPIVGFQAGKPPYYVANGGPFQEPDYYGFNDTYTISSLSYSEVHHPTNWKQLTVTIEFASTATTNSKIMFLCYGTDAKGQPAETPFSGGTMFFVPEVASTIMGLTAIGSACGVYFLRKRKK